MSMRNYILVQQIIVRDDDAVLVYIAISNRYYIVTVTRRQSYELVMMTSHMLRERFGTIPNDSIVCNGIVNMYHGGDRRYCTC